MFLKAAASMAILLMLHSGVIATMIALDDGRQVSLMQQRADQTPSGWPSYALNGEGDLNFRQGADVSLDEAHRHCDWLMPQLFGWCERLVARMKKQVGKSLKRSSMAIPGLPRWSTVRQAIYATI